MTTKIWRGDAQPVAQVTHVTPDDVEIGDEFTLTINGKSITVTATAATPENVVDLFAAAIAASDIPEFGELESTTDGDILVLTAADPGVPFTITATASNGGVGGVTVATTVQGSAPEPTADAVVSFEIPTGGCTGNFKVWHLGNASGLIAVGASAATVETAIEAISSVGAGNVNVTLSTVSPDGIVLNGEVSTYTVTFAGALAASYQTFYIQLFAAGPVSRRTRRDSAGAFPRQGGQFEITFPEGTRFSFEYAAKTFTLDYDGNSTSTFTMELSAFDVEGIMGTDLFGGMGEPWHVNEFGLPDNIMRIEVFDPLIGYDIPMVTATSVAGCATTLDVTVTIVTAGSDGSSGVDEVQTVTISSGASGGTFTLTFSGQTTSAIAYNASAATVDTALEALSNIGVGDVAVTGSAGGPWTVTFGGALGDANQLQMTADGSSLTGGATEGFTVSEFVASAGPNHWDTAANWLPSGVPANGDNVKFELGNSDCLYGLSQSAVTLASLHIAQTYRGKIGLPRVNSNDYFEYRTFELTIGATSILIGHGDGPGSGKIALNTGTVQAAIVVRDSGGSSDFGIAPITWRGTHTSNTLQVLGGEVGTCPYSDQTATLASLEQLGGSIDLKHTSILGSLTVAANHKAYDCTHAGEVYSA